MGDRENQKNRKGGVGLKERDEERTRKPRMYSVVLLNDDYTPIDFVVSLVETVFRKSTGDAMAITLEVHEKGSAIAGVFTHEIAETKVAQSQLLARQHDHPLVLTMEPT